MGYLYNKTFAKIIVFFAFFASCDDYASLKNELIKQTTLVYNASLAVTQADTVHAAISSLQKFNEEMNLHYQTFISKRNQTIRKTSIFANPPRSLQKEVQELKTAIAVFRETLSLASLNCDDARLRNTLIHTIATLEKTLHQ
ncbi:MAG: hypothetical protein N2316_13245 [Spirochaetes bacterium]|nr:hypothetical protein [Spirochaetota bacterium]